jgi:Protein of unknown function (DUF3617)
MRALRVILIGVAISACALFSARAADNTPLNVKPGLWEITTEGHNSGAPPIPPQVMAQMSPEQRAQMEAHLKDIMAQQAQRRVTQRCVTQEEIAKGFDKLNSMTQGQCTQTVIASTPTRREGRLQCTGRTTGTGTYHFEAPNPETFSGSWDWDMTSGDSSNRMNLKNSMQGKWLAADCGNVKPGNN